MTDEKNADTTADASGDGASRPESAAEQETAPAPAAAQPATSEAAEPAPAAADDDVAPETGAVDERGEPQYGIGPFSIREVALGGVWALAFLISFFPVYGRIGDGASVWTSGIDWVLTIAVPTIAVFLIALRRLSPQGIRRVGSLGIDQFASVAFSVSTVIWLGILWSSFVSLAGQRVFFATWVVWLEFLLMFAGVFLTTLAPFFPTLQDDFAHRADVSSHPFARPARPVVARPAADPVEASGAATVAAAEPAATTAAFDAQSTARPTAAQPQATQAFWALAPEERAVVSDSGETLFTIGPTAWALVIEDRGDYYLVRHEDGRVGQLRDVSGVTRG